MAETDDAGAGHPVEKQDEGARREAPRRRRGRGGPLAVLALVVVGALGTGYWYVKLRGVVSTDDAYVDGDRATVTTKMLGRIDSLCADEGDTVRSGQLLIVLDDADLRAHLAQADAQLELARTSVALTEVSQERAQDDFDRAELQLASDAIPRQDFDHARMALASADAEHRIAVARVDAAQASVDVVRQQLSDTRVTAPFRGVVAKRWLLPGDVVQPGQPVLTLYDVDRVWVTAVFEETKLRYLPVGTRVQLSVDAYPDRTFEGTVSLVGAAAASQFSLIPPNNASGNFTKVTQRVPVRIALDRDGGGGTGGAADPVRLLPGMSVVVTVSRRE